MCFSQFLPFRFSWQAPQEVGGVSSVCAWSGDVEGHQGEGGPKEHLWNQELDPLTKIIFLLLLI